MTKDEIIALAKEAGVLDVHSANVYMCSQSELFRFASAIQEKERERCAKICDEYTYAENGAQWSAEAIRSLE